MRNEERASGNIPDVLEEGKWVDELGGSRRRGLPRRPSHPPSGRPPRPSKDW